MQIFSVVLSQMEMTAGPLQCVWCVEQCSVPRVIAVRQSLKGLLWGQPQSMPTSVEGELEYSSGRQMDSSLSGLQFYGGPGSLFYAVKIHANGFIKFYHFLVIISVF